MEEQKVVDTPIQVVAKRFKTKATTQAAVDALPFGSGT